MLGLVPSATLLGVDGHAVTVEVHVSSGLPSFTVVGSPDAACREASGRVRAALLSSGCTWPHAAGHGEPGAAERAQDRRRASTSPSRSRSSSRPSRSTPAAVEGLAFLGELGLDGSVRPVPGTLCLAEALGERRGRAARRPAPPRRGWSAAAPIRAVATLAELVACLRGRAAVARRAAASPPPPPLPRVPDLADVRGQPVGRFALEVAAAGGHHLLLLGPPGAGKTMLAPRLPGPAPAAHRPGGARDHPHPLGRRPRAAAGRARAPAAVPGAAPRRVVGRAGRRRQRHDAPGRDQRRVQRRPLPRRAGRVRRSTCSTRCASRSRRASCGWRGPPATVTFPARFLLVAAMNPCPCGDGGRPGGCRCTDGARARYQRRLSGPLLDRFDLRVEVTRPSVTDLMGAEPQRAHRGGARAGAGGAGGRRRAGRRAPTPRSRSTGSTSSRRSHPDAADVLAQALRSGRLSARGLHRVRRVARTVADLQGAPRDVVTAEHVAIALSLRADAAAGTPDDRALVGMTDDRDARLRGPPRRPPGGRARAGSRELLDGAGAGGGLDARSAATRAPTRSRVAGRAPTTAGIEIAASPATRATPTGCAHDPRAAGRAVRPGRPRRARADVRVAIVGTRRCTGAGAGFARELGRELADAGVAVVSGLALGIDGAAHRGVLEAGGRPVGVVGSGLDVVYPAEHRDLWERVARRRACSSARRRSARGPTPWRFPARNRIIAALADLVVVVESHAAGGSMHTVREAADRDIPVMAVPGLGPQPGVGGHQPAPRRRLRARCATPPTCSSPSGSPPPPEPSAADPRAPPDPRQKVVLDALDWEPATLEHLAVRTGLRLPDLALALEGAARRRAGSRPTAAGTSGSSP